MNWVIILILLKIGLVDGCRAALKREILEMESPSIIIKA